MSLYLITGSAGAGKSTIQQELVRKGFLAFDTDDPEKTGLSALHEKATSKEVARYNEFNWGHEGISFETHVWGLTNLGFARVVDESTARDVFLVGRLREPMQELEDALSKTFFLELPNAIVAERLRSRAAQARNNPDVVMWGMEESQIDFTVAQNQTLADQYRSLGAVMIDASPEPSVIADAIERHL